MKLRMYSVYDRAVSAFTKPMFCHTDAEAVRAFADAVRDPQMPFGKHPSDYQLFFVGEWDDQPCEFMAGGTAIRPLVEASSFAEPS